MSAYLHAPSLSFCRQASGQRQHRVNTRGLATYPKPLDSATLPSVRPMVYRRAGAAKARGSVRNAATREIMVVVLVMVQVAESSRRPRQQGYGHGRDTVLLSRYSSFSSYRHHHVRHPQTRNERGACSVAEPRVVLTPRRPARRPPCAHSRPPPSPARVRVPPLHPRAARSPDSSRRPRPGTLPPRDQGIQARCSGKSKISLRAPR